MKQFKLAALVLALVMLLAGCGEEEPNETLGGLDWLPGLGETGETEGAEDLGDLVILYTNDVHNAYTQDLNTGSLGYTSLTAYRDALEEKGDTVLLIDGGDSLQGDAIGTLSQGAYMVDIMNEAGYVFAVPGDRDFAFGMGQFLELAENVAEYTYISCNFVDLSTGNPVFAPYVMEEYSGKKIAFLGISTPETVTGEDAYGVIGAEDPQALYDCVQKAIDEARNEGADAVIAIGHLGTANVTGWSSIDVIHNTVGLTAFLDGHSHTQGAGVGIFDKDENEVAYCSNGDRFSSFGEIRLDLGTGEAENTSLVMDFYEQDLNMTDFVGNITSQYESLLEQVAFRSEVSLTAYAPDQEERLIRKQETNLGDFCADACRVLLSADVGLVNGGAIGGQLAEGPVTYGDILALQPYGNSLCLAEVTGQQLLDALEFAYRAAGEKEFGGFLQVSGLTCEIDTSIASSVKVDENEQFAGVEGERRVKNVKIGGEDIDPKETYTVAGYEDILKLFSGGFTMFSGRRLLREDVMPDHQVLMDYIRDELGGVIPADRYGNPDGDGRIKLT